MRQTIKLGSRGDDVKFLQSALNISPADGIFGPSTDKAVKAFQKSRGIKQDGIVGSYTWTKIEALVTMSSAPAKLGNGVVYNPIDKHITHSPNREIKYLVIHYTAGGSSKGDADLNTRKVFINREASADFVVDDNSMLQVNPDPRNYYCWAVGDKGDGRKKTIANKDCVSIEICSNLMKGTSAAVPNHTGWYFSEESLNNAIKLSKMIMDAYNIDIDHVIRHYDVTGKMCPGIPGWNKGKMYDAKTGKLNGKLNNEDSWIDFKNKLI